MVASIIRNRLFLSWVVLVALTLMSVEVFAGIGGDHRVAGVAVLLVALVKAGLIGSEFMEVRETPVGMRWAFGVWLAVIGVSLIGFYWMQGTKFGS